MKVLVVGATGGSGKAAVAELLDRGHEVTAFSRSAASLHGMSDRLLVVVGDATDTNDIDQAVRGQDAVLVTLGISENPLRVRVLGRSGTPIQVRSQGTRNVIAAMRAHGVSRLVVQTSYGVGETRRQLPLRYRLLFRLLLGPQIADTELQDQAVHDSGLDWVIAQPVTLTDAREDGEPFTSTRGEVGAWHVSRSRVGRFLAQALEAPTYVGQTVALSQDPHRADG